MKDQKNPALDSVVEAGAWMAMAAKLHMYCTNKALKSVSKVRREANKKSGKQMVQHVHLGRIRKSILLSQVAVQDMESEHCQASELNRTFGYDDPTEKQFDECIKKIEEDVIAQTRDTRR